MAQPPLLEKEGNGPGSQTNPIPFVTISTPHNIVARRNTRFRNDQPPFFEICRIVLRHRMSPAADSRSKPVPDTERSIIHSLAQKGLECRLKGQYEDAEAAYRKALTLAERCFQPMESAMGQLLNDVAVLYKYNGQFN